MFGVIQGFSSLILMEDGLESSLKENVEQMKDSSVQASDLAKTILTSAGCSRVTLDPVAIGSLLPWIETKSREACDKYGVELQFSGASNLPEVLADANKLHELIGELVKNAAEAAASQPDGKVAIDVLKVSDEQNTIDFFIRNTSPDVSPEALVKFFAPFHSSKDPSVANGLGLTTAAILAGQMQMRLGLRSSEGTMTAWLCMKAV